MVTICPAFHILSQFTVDVSVPVKELFLCNFWGLPYAQFIKIKSFHLVIVEGLVHLYVLEAICLLAVSEVYVALVSQYAYIDRR